MKMKKIKIQIGHHLCELRKERKLKQKDVADYLGISIAVYSMYETDKHEPSLSTIIGLAELYGTTTDNILNV